MIHRSENQLPTRSFKIGIIRNDGKIADKYIICNTIVEMIPVMSDDKRKKKNTVIECTRTSFVWFTRLKHNHPVHTVTPSYT